MVLTLWVISSPLLVTLKEMPLQKKGKTSVCAVMLTTEFLLQSLIC